MKFVLALWTVLLLTAAAASGNPLQDKSSEEDKDELSKKNLFNDEFIKYRGEHTITNLVIAFTGDMFSDDVSDPVLFFNQVDIKPNGEKVEFGQFMLVNDTAQKIFDGRCSTTDLGKPGVYFGAKDGLYIYNERTKGADKLGTITDSIVQLQITNGTNEIYILTEPDYRIYKVNREGTEKTLVAAIPSAKAFVLDRSNDIYYYDENKVLYVLSVGSTEPVQFSSFANVESSILVRPPMLVESDGALYVVGEEMYILKSDGTKELYPVKLMERPTSICMDASLLQYYALDNNIYELNVIVALIADMDWHDVLDGIKGGDTENTYNLDTIS